MTSLTLAGAACALLVLGAGTASAMPAAPAGPGVRAPVEAAALLKRGTAAGKAKQRYRTRLDRCRNVPSRC